MRRPSRAADLPPSSQDPPGISRGGFFHGRVPCSRRTEVGTHTVTPRHGGKAREIMTKAMPVGLGSVTAPSRSAARGAPVKGDGRDPRVRGSQLDLWIGQTHRGEHGDLRDQVLPTGALRNLELTELDRGPGGIPSFRCGCQGHSCPGGPSARAGRRRTSCPRGSRGRSPIRDPRGPSRPRSGRCHINPNTTPTRCPTCRTIPRHWGASASRCASHFSNSHHTTRWHPDPFSYPHSSRTPQSSSQLDRHSPTPLPSAGETQNHSDR